MNDAGAERAATGQLGRWVALATATVAAISLGVGVMTPPRSGPFCNQGCIDYPYTDAAAYVPGITFGCIPECCSCCYS